MYFNKTKYKIWKTYMKALRNLIFAEGLVLNIIYTY